MTVGKIRKGFLEISAHLLCFQSMDTFQKKLLLTTNEVRVEKNAIFHCPLSDITLFRSKFVFVTYRICISTQIMSARGMRSCLGYLINWPNANQNLSTYSKVVADVVYELLKHHCTSYCRFSFFLLMSILALLLFANLMSRHEVKFSWIVRHSVEN